MTGTALDVSMSQDNFFPLLEIFVKSTIPEVVDVCGLLMTAAGVSGHAFRRNFLGMEAF